MHSMYIDADFGDDERRQKLYDGDLFVYSPRPSTLALTEFAGEMAREAFAPLDPETAQFDMAVEDYAALLAELNEPILSSSLIMPGETEPLFDMDDIAADRFGVRESILGRVHRRGGTADVTSRAGWGTEVRLRMPRDGQTPSGEPAVDIDEGART